MKMNKFSLKGDEQSPAGTSAEGGAANNAELFERLKRVQQHMYRPGQNSDSPSNEQSEEKDRDD